MAGFRCTVCNCVYDEEREGTPFAELPDSYACPVCGALKFAFVREGLPEKGLSVRTAVADRLVEQLMAAGVKHIHGIPGDSNLPLIDAIR
ncbi:MAG: rubredoxin [Candidatus Bipolaricaulia bacterium]